MYEEIVTFPPIVLHILSFYDFDIFFIFVNSTLNVTWACIHWEHNFLSTLELERLYKGEM